MQEYIRYEVYRCPTRPDESGEYIGSTPILKQALEASERLTGGGFIKGITPDGSKILIL